MELEKNVWPYVLPFPVDIKQRRLVWKILQSKVGMGILARLNVEKPTYQKELIRKLPYSNKSIIEYLKLMVSAGIVEHGMEKVRIKKKNVWVKWYKPTKFGKWLILFLKSPQEISRETVKETVEELFQIYSANIVEFCQKYNLNMEYFHQVLDEKFLEEWRAETPQIKPEVVVFGSAAIDLYGSIEKLPEHDETAYIEVFNVSPGGMGANVAVALSRLNVPVAFIGKIGSDQAGRLLLENLRKNRVNVSNIVIERGKASLQTLILFGPKSERRIIAIGLPNPAISVSSPEEINWKLLKSSKIVYIGEVFIEVASAIADFAKNSGKTVIYRPGTPYLKLGVDRIRDVLEHTDIFILNEIGWSELKRSSKGRLSNINGLQKYGPETIILTKGGTGCEIWTDREHRVYPISKDLVRRFKIVDPTGAGDSFSAALIKKLLDGSSFEEAIYFAQVAACITCSRLGASPAFPTLEEIMENYG